MGMPVAPSANLHSPAVGTTVGACGHAGHGSTTNATGAAPGGATTALGSVFADLVRQLTALISQLQQMLASRPATGGGSGAVDAAGGALFANLGAPSDAGDPARRDDLSRPVGASATSVAGAFGSDAGRAPQHLNNSTVQQLPASGAVRPAALVPSSTGTSGSGPVPATVTLRPVSAPAPTTTRPVTSLHAPSSTSVGGSFGSGSPAVATAPPRGPYAFIWKGKYYYPVAPAGNIDMTSRDAIQTRVIKSVVKHMQDEEKVTDFGITGFAMRDVSVSTDRELFIVNPGARYVFDVTGTTGTGEVMTIPVVMNVDGSTFVDPRVHF